MIVREALVADPRVLAGSATLQEAADLLTHPHVESVLVADDGQLLGCITTGTVVRAVAAGADPRTTRAADVCDRDLVTVGPDVPLDEALHLMVERDIERLPVTEDGRLLGILPREPLVRRLAEEEAS